MPLRPLAAAAAVLLLAACGAEPDAPAPAPEAPAPDAVAAADLPADADGPLVVYAGRKEALVGPLVERFREETGLEVEVRYGGDAELLATLAEEGAASPADVFWANTPGALGEAVEQDLLTPLPDTLLGLPGRFVPASARWVPLSVRFRVIAYDPERVDPHGLPASVLGLPAVEALQGGRIGWTPAYSSFQDFLTALRIAEGAEAAQAWLAAMQGADAQAYPSNSPMLDALRAGEIDVALTNHYYVLRANADGAGLAWQFFGDGDAGNLALVTGGGVLGTSGRQRAARAFLAFLLSDASQRAAAETLYEVPVLPGAASPDGFPPFDEASSAGPTDFDVERLRELDETLDLLRSESLL